MFSPTLLPSTALGSQLCQGPVPSYHCHLKEVPTGAAQHLCELALGVPWNRSYLHSQDPCKHCKCSKLGHSNLGQPLWQCRKQSCLLRKEKTAVWYNQVLAAWKNLQAALHNSLPSLGKTKRTHTNTIWLDTCFYPFSLAVTSVSTWFPCQQLSLRGLLPERMALSHLLMLYCCASKRLFGFSFIPQCLAQCQPTLAVMYCSRSAIFWNTPCWIHFFLLKAL